MKLKLAFSALTATALIGGGAYAALAAPNSPEAAPVTATGTSTAVSAATPTAAPTPGDRTELTASEAVAAALKAYPGAAVAAVERDDDRAGRWEIDLLSTDEVRHELTVDTATGAVRVDRADGDDGRDDDRDDDAEDRAALRAASVDVRQAVAAALASVPGAVESAEIDDDGGPGARWEVEVRGEDGRAHELHVDARTAAVTPDRDDDDRYDD
ncbi:PepSY domain-containing protein [Streptomyces paludis]|nr:PepSY domain-containing protein [Streptomyces paludis]